MSIARAPLSPGRLPLLRPQADRVIGGVCAGLAAHFGLRVAVVRVAMVLAALIGGAGAALYVFWWLTVPAGDPAAAARAARPAVVSRLAPGLRAKVRQLPVRDIAIGVILLTAAGLLIAWRVHPDLQLSWILPVLIALGGAALAWSQLDTVDSTRRFAVGGRTPAGVVAIAAGFLLVLVGALLLANQKVPFGSVVRAAVAALAVLCGAAVVLAPWWLRLVRALGDERAARAREAERADIAAHLHDSVLQTLALIRAQAHDAGAVARLARAQERELREWLYDDRACPGMSLAAELRSLVGEVEDGRTGKTQPDGSPIAPVAIDTVVVGDCVPTPESTALLQATREALVNAVAHGRPPVSVYLEVSDAAVEVFVRDHGEGFDLADIAADRFGVRESILGRVRRRGGTADMKSRPGWGTEVRLRMPRAGGAAGANGAGANGVGQNGANGAAAPEPASGNASNTPTSASTRGTAKETP